MAHSVDALEVAAAGCCAAVSGRWCAVRHSFIGRIARVPVRRASPPSRSQACSAASATRYLIVYPFTKSTDWYLLSREVRQGVMNEHMKVGHRVPEVRQALAYSFGLDDQDFVVAYETDDLPAFGELVRELRGTESGGRRCATRRSCWASTARRTSSPSSWSNERSRRRVDRATGGLRARAEACFPGGVNSPVRAFRSVGRPPLILERGAGPYVWDADGRRYLDFIGALGPARSSATRIRP